MASFFTLSFPARRSFPTVHPSLTTLWPRHYSSSLLLVRQILFTCDWYLQNAGRKQTHTIHAWNNMLNSNDTFLHSRVASMWFAPFLRMNPFFSSLVMLSHSHFPFHFLLCQHPSNIFASVLRSLVCFLHSSCVSFVCPLFT